MFHLGIVATLDFQYCVTSFERDIIDYTSIFTSPSLCLYFSQGLETPVQSPDTASLVPYLLSYRTISKSPPTTSLLLLVFLFRIEMIMDFTKKSGKRVSVLMYYSGSIKFK